MSQAATAAPINVDLGDNLSVDLGVGHGIDHVVPAPVVGVQGVSFGRQQLEVS
jgi:hypothetical protein